MTQAVPTDPYLRDAPDALDAAATDPTTPPPAAPKFKIVRFLVFLLPPVAALLAMFNGLQSVIIPAQVAAFDPAHKVANLALMTTFAAIASMLANPIGGAVSDRTRSRFGRRTPWLVALSLVSGVLMIAMGLTQNLILFGVIYAVLWFANNMYQATLLAVLPDRVPMNRRGIVSAFIGLGTPIGVLVGVNVASHVGQVAGYSILAGLLVITALWFVFGAREGSAVDIPLPKHEGRRNPALFFAAFRSRDFTLAFVSRFMLFLSYFTVSGYLFYTLSDYIGTDNVPGGDVAVAVSNLLSVTVIAWVLVATVLGWVADKIDRRKLFVGVSAIGLAATFFVPIISPTWNGMLIYSVLLGIFIGTYFAVDLALMSLVLPDEERAGRDLGILSVATGLPQIVSGALAGGIILLAGYTALYIFGACAALVAGVVIFFVKKVR